MEEISIEVNDKEEPLTLKVLQDPNADKSSYIFVGKDKQGKFQTTRTIKEFYLLYDNYLKRWPCIYIPPAPSISLYEQIETIRYIIQAEKDNRYFNEKRYFIQLFFQKITLYPFLYKSHELN